MEVFLDSSTFFAETITELSGGDSMVESSHFASILCFIMSEVSPISSIRRLFFTLIFIREVLELKALELRVSVSTLKEESLEVDFIGSLVELDITEGTADIVIGSTFSGVRAGSTVLRIYTCRGGGACGFFGVK